MHRTCTTQRIEVKDHWKTKGLGALDSPGTFGSYIKRDRFIDICRYLHMTNNEDPRAKQDRAWKIRSVSDALQKTFRTGYKLGKYIAFDEAVIPGRSSMHAFRQYFKDKPHKFGTKLFMLCCGTDAYCSR
jgi:hypothetical protein